MDIKDYLKEYGVEVPEVPKEVIPAPPSKSEGDVQSDLVRENRILRERNKRLWDDNRSLIIAYKQREEALGGFPHRIGGAKIIARPDNSYRADWL